MSSNKKMGLMQLTIIVAVNMMGSGIIMLPANLAQVGTISMLSWLVTAVGSMAIAYAFAQCGFLCPRSGGMSAYAEEAHGKSAFFMASYTYYISLAIANVAIAISAVGYAVPFFPWLGSSPVHICIGVIVLLWLTSFANFGGPRLTGRIGSVTVWGVIIPVAGLCVIGWFWFKPDLFMAAWNPHHLPFGHAVSSSIALTLWAFLGMESACANSDAVDNPKKNVPLACLLGTGGAAIIYILSTAVMQGIVPNAELASSTAPFGMVFAEMFNPTVGLVVMVLAVIACIGSLLGWQFTISQVSKAAADAGMFPKFFSKLNRADAPVLGMCFIAAVQTVMALMTISPNLNKQFEVLVNLAVFTNVVPYVLALSALICIMKKSGITGRVYQRNLLICMVALIYSFYGLYAAGMSAVFWGALVTIAGYFIYGFKAYDFEKTTIVESEITEPVVDPDEKELDPVMML
ncbi:putrescine-ornithine antiporter [Dongshaea marina]|uniref:putrescine-ornithine antiporter n=1 Tax=Dongshaea marina TaxID=2047966 RepID=UPI000D3EAE14|nr:putrescine-ornithine antiporter [Dongshaea marina]